MDFNIYEFSYENRVGNLNAEAKSKVKSEKHFPVFKIDDEKYIFKSLSKTKPFLTPLFAYSEVFWSTLINQYLDEKAPIYKLAICHGLSESMPKYYERGTIVKSLITDDERLINLFEFFRDNPDRNVDIDDYTNYCGIYYDYTQILNSDFFRENTKLGEQLARQILISILKSDNNYHYENVGFISKKDKLLLAPPIDHEFSNLFFAVDDSNFHRGIFAEFIMALNDIFQNNEMKQKNILKNIDLICERYPDVAADFVDRIRRIQPADILDNGYIEPFNTYSYKVGIEEFKNNNPEKAELLRQIIKPKQVNIEEISYAVKKELSITIDVLDKVLSKKI